MCTTGNLSVCATAGTNRSISTAVGTGSGSLSALSVSAGKTAPHSMLEFYGYSPGLSIRVDTQWVGTCGGGNGMCGQVYLKCGATVVCSASIIAWEQGECQYNWDVPVGTYCVRWCNFCSIGGGSSITCIKWSKNNPTGSGGASGQPASVNSSSFSASGCIQGCVCPIY